MGGKHAPLNKEKRVRKRDLITNRYEAPPSPGGNNRRAPYFKHFRAERSALNRLENTFTSKFSYKTNRAIKYLYYFVLPHLSRCLWHQPDRVRLINVEHDLYNQLQSYWFIREKEREPNRIYVHLDKTPTIDYGLSKALTSL